jgi:FlaA1/EpsC-like NDP-sugar epimerase
MSDFHNTSILITGGAGTFGSEMARQLLEKNPQSVIIFSRNEQAQVMMREKFKDDRLKFIIGDIRDARAIREACEGVNYVFHFSALKHVVICENQPREAILTNVTGSQNVIDACIQNNVDVCVNISSDKSCYATCFYGKTKAIAEGLFTEANNITTHTDFFTFRSGNLFGSSGSVVPIWINQIKQRNYICVTGEKMRRFFITPEDAVKAIFKAMDISDRGEIFVPKMDCFYISDLAKVLVEKYGNEKTEIKSIPPFPYERINEWLLTPEESKRCVNHKNFYIIYPLIDIKTTNYPLEKFRMKNGLTMNDAPESCVDKLKKLVEKAGY